MAEGGFRRALGDLAGALVPLSARELQVVKLLVDCTSTTHAAIAHAVSATTIDTHRQRAYKKLVINNIPDLTKLAVRAELTTLDPSSRTDK